MAKEDQKEGMRIRDLVEVPEIRTVIQFEDLKDPSLRHMIVQTFVLTAEVLSNLQAVLTSLSGQELQGALGGALRAKAVFLFVDTCHSGALAGARGDDLNFEVTTSGVYMMASSGATQFSYESPEWGHGAFTYALLRSLKKEEYAREGIIHFNALTYAVPDELAALLQGLGQNAYAMRPVVPLEGRRLDEPVAQVHGGNR